MKHYKKQIANKSQATLLIFLGWLVYTISYLGKVNYSANITQVIDFYGITKTQAGAVPTFFFFSYGVGQVFNGIFCKKYNIKWMIFTSLFVSAVINIIIAISTDFSIMKWLWLINGFSLSVLWPTIVRLLSETLPKKVLGTSSVVMGTTVAIGTLIIYGLSSIFAAFDKFKLSFYTAGISVFIVSVIWLILYNKAVILSVEERKDDDIEEKEEADETIKNEQGKWERKSLFVSIYVLCFFSIGVNLIKDGLTTWVPSIIKEEFFMSDSISILLTLFLPIIAVFGNVGALRMHERIPDYVNHCGAVFVIIAVFIGVIIGSLKLELIYFMIIGLVIVNFFASSLNSLITSIFPLFMRGKVNSGLFAGVLNGFCYVGSTISSYGLGAIADNYGWANVFYTLVGFCLAAFVVWNGYACLKSFYNRKITKR